MVATVGFRGVRPSRAITVGSLLSPQCIAVADRQVQKPIEMQ